MWFDTVHRASRRVRQIINAIMNDGRTKNKTNAIHAILENSIFDRRYMDLHFHQPMVEEDHWRHFFCIPPAYLTLHLMGVS